MSGSLSRQAVPAVCMGRTDGQIPKQVHPPHSPHRQTQRRDRGDDPVAESEDGSEQGGDGASDRGLLSHIRPQSVWL